MLLDRSPTWAKFVGTDDERTFLAEYLSFPDARKRFGGGGDGTIRMLTPVNTFPSGLVPLVEKAAKREGFEVSVRDLCRPAAIDPDANLAWLRDYQADALAAALKARVGIIHIPTAGGKGELVVALARAVPTRWLFLVHRSTLVTQTAERFDRRNREHGVGLDEAGFKMGELDRDSESVVFATYQTVSRWMDSDPDACKEWLARFGGVVADEAHTAAADSFFRVVMALRNAAWRIGLSATPLDRSDRRSTYVIACLGPIVYRIKTATLVAAGAVARPTIHMVKVDHGKQRTFSSYDSAYKSRIVQSARRNEIVVKVTAAAEKPCFVFVRQEAHGHALANMLQRRGMQTRFIYGAHSGDARDRSVRDLVAGRLDVVVASVVFQEGLDVPELMSAVNATGLKATIPALQFLGRAMRNLDRNGRTTKDSFTYWDLFDSYDAPRDADEQRDWFRDAAIDRRRAYLKAGHEVIVVDPPA